MRFVLFSCESVSPKFDEFDLNRVRLLIDLLFFGLKSRLVFYVSSFLGEYLGSLQCPKMASLF
jgi:hypothetical protein